MHNNKIDVPGEIPRGVWIHEYYDEKTDEFVSKNLTTGDEFRQPRTLKPLKGGSEINDKRQRVFNSLMKIAQKEESFGKQLIEFEKHKEEATEKLRESKVEKRHFIMNVAYCNYDWEKGEFTGYYFYSEETGERFPKDPKNCYEGQPVEVPFHFPREEQYVIIDGETIPKTNPYTKNFLK